jgi:hypothetical protein
MGVLMYQDLRKYIKTGDVIGFSGKGRTSNIIKGATFCDISHVGIVYKTLADRVIIMESTSLNNIADCATGEFFKGVQQQYLSDRIKHYDGQVYWYALNDDILPSKEHQMLCWLKDKHGKRTSYDTLQAIGAGLDVLLPDNIEDFRKLFCSELVCKALQLAGMISESLNASEQTPADVVGYDCLNERIQIR